MPDLDVGSTIYWIVDKRTGQTFGKPRPNQAAAQKRADRANQDLCDKHELGPDGIVYAVRPAQIVAVLPTDDTVGLLDAAKEATRKAHKAGNKPDGYEWSAAEALAISDLHRDARELWFGIWSESHDEFASFVLDAHDAEQDGWLEFVQEVG